MKVFQAKSAVVETPVRSPEPLKVGDVVKLKSGGPMMTVNNFDGDRVWCLWFDYSGEHSRYPVALVSSGSFPAACLDIFEDDKGD